MLDQRARRARSVRGFLCALVASAALSCGDDDAGGADASSAIDAAMEASTSMSDATPDATGVIEDGSADSDAAVMQDAEPPTDLAPCELPAQGFDGTASGPPVRALEGPGGPNRAFEESELYQACGYLDGGPTDPDHHNTVLMLDGYLFMPWAHEAGGGGISVFDVSDPCSPTEIATATHPDMRETHAAGVAFIGGRRWMAVSSLVGIQLWDISDVNAMEMVIDFALPGVRYPDAYARVVMSLFFQAPYIYVGAADNGVFVVDASDPTAPRLVHQLALVPELRVGNVQAIGTLLSVIAAEGSRAALLDIGNPENPIALPGGSYIAEGYYTSTTRLVPLPAYFGTVNGGRAYFARSVLGGGLITMDISDPSRPTFVSSYRAEGDGANGGYVFFKDDRAYVGLSGFAQIIDLTDPTMPAPVATLDMQGDFDTLVPLGNVAVGSVDDGAVDGQASALFPVDLVPDSMGPRVNMVHPKPDATEVSLAARVGLTFTEPIELHSASPAAFFVRKVGSTTPLAGHYSGQESVLSFAPGAFLEPDTEYEIVLAEGGIADANGNGLRAQHRSTFRTARCEAP